MRYHPIEQETPAIEFTKYCTVDILALKIPFGAPKNVIKN